MKEKKGGPEPLHLVLWAIGISVVGFFTMDHGYAEQFGVIWNIVNGKITIARMEIPYKYLFLLSIALLLWAAYLHWKKQGARAV
jgi:hypothetical protein